MDGDISNTWDEVSKCINLESLKGNEIPSKEGCWWKKEIQQTTKAKMKNY